MSFRYAQLCFPVNSELDRMKPAINTLCPGLLPGQCLVDPAVLEEKRTTPMAHSWPINLRGPQSAYHSDLVTHSVRVPLYPLIEISTELKRL